MNNEHAIVDQSSDSSDHAAGKPADTAARGSAEKRFPLFSRFPLVRTLLLLAAIVMGLAFAMHWLGLGDANIKKRPEKATTMLAQGEVSEPSWPPEPSPTAATPQPAAPPPSDTGVCYEPAGKEIHEYDSPSGSAKKETYRNSDYEDVLKWTGRQVGEFIEVRSTRWYKEVSSVWVDQDEIVKVSCVYRQAVILDLLPKGDQEFLRGPVSRTFLGFVCLWVFWGVLLFFWPNLLDEHPGKVLLGILGGGAMNIVFMDKLFLDLVYFCVFWVVLLFFRPNLPDEHPGKVLLWILGSGAVMIIRRMMLSLSHSSGDVSYIQAFFSFVIFGGMGALTALVPLNWFFDIFTIRKVVSVRHEYEDDD
ncbi:MAG: hypothetical protein AB1411_02600 [Nitrospirota bacterium]